jgi:hypothetical protein
MDSIKRDVVVPRCDDDGHTPKVAEERPGLLIFSHLGPLREISRQDDDIGHHPPRQIEKCGGDTRPMGFTKVYVRPV